MGFQETIIYRLVLTNPVFGPYLPFSIFWAHKPTKKLTHFVELLGHLLSRNHVSNFCVSGPPLYSEYVLLSANAQYAGYPVQSTEMSYSDH